MEMYNSDGNISEQYKERQKKNSEATDRAMLGDPGDGGGGALGGVGGGMMGMAFLVVGIIFGIGVIVFIFTTLANLGLILWRFPLYLLVIPLLVGVFTIVIRIISNATVLGCLLLAVTMVAGLGGAGYLGCKGVAAIYGSGNRYYPSEYCGDYIRKLPDGSTPKLYEKRNGRGEEVAVLKPGQWVKVNGINFTKKEYNITTWEGVTGWVPVEAFPKDGADWLFDRFRNDFSTEREVSIDRQVASYAKKYLNGESYPTSFNDATLRQAVRVNAQTPFMRLSRKEFKETDDTLFTESGMTVTLERIVYPNAERTCTMIHLSVTNADNYFEHQHLGETFESLAVKDLDTGKTYGVIPGYYRNHEWEADGKRNVVFFFWPFQSRHFSLMHTAHPEVERRGAGLFRKLASVTPGLPGCDYFTDWNFEEIRVR